MNDPISELTKKYMFHTQPYIIAKFVFIFNMRIF